jgi:hypothetical protein
MERGILVPDFCVHMCGFSSGGSITASTARNADLHVLAIRLGVALVIYAQRASGPTDLLLVSCTSHHAVAQSAIFRLVGVLESIAAIAFAPVLETGVGKAGIGAEIDTRLDCHIVAVSRFACEGAATYSFRSTASVRPLF